MWFEIIDIDVNAVQHPIAEIILIILPMTRYPTHFRIAYSYDISLKAYLVHSLFCVILFVVNWKYNIDSESSEIGLVQFPVSFCDLQY